MLRLNSDQNGFWKELEALLAWEGVADDQVVGAVRDILADVRVRGDEALLEYTRRFDHVDIDEANELELGAERLAEALQTIPAAERAA